MFTEKNKKIIFWALAIAIVVVAAFFRMYRIPDFLMFLSDQGRDAIVLKRLITFEKLVFVGPTTSIGNVFTGPFYYYLVAPFMGLSRLHPAGPAYGVAIINLILLVVSFVWVRRLFGRACSLIFLVFAAWSANQILQSRFSWNPNPVSGFVFLTLLSMYEAIRKNQLKWYATAGVLLGFSLQLHYVAAVLLVPFAAAIIIQRSVRKSVKGLLVGVLAAFVTFTPLILFEVKNKFINLQTLMRASSTGEVQAKNTDYLPRLLETVVSFIGHALVPVYEFPKMVEFEPAVILKSYPTLLLLGLFVVVLSAASYLVYRRWKGTKHALLLMMNIVLIVSYVFAFAVLETGRHVHYFNTLYFSFYLLVAWLLVQLYHYRKAVGVVAVIVLLSVFTYLQVPKVQFLFDAPSPYSQIADAQEVARYIISQTNSPQYQVVGLPFYETEGHFRYFLEYYGKRPMTADALGDPKELFVICHDNPGLADCDIPGNPQWQIADFQNRHKDWKIESMEKVVGVRIYKLVY